VVVQRDLEEVGIWPEIWLWHFVNSGSYLKPHAPYVLTEEEKKMKLKTPTNYVGTLHSRVQKDGKLRALKSHHYHILMLPLCLRNLMCEEVKMSLISLSQVFKIICSKAIDLKTMPMLRFKWFLLLKIQLYSKKPGFGRENQLSSW
jgi:hypothetical protein